MLSGLLKFSWSSLHGLKIVAQFQVSSLTLQLLKCRETSLGSKKACSSCHPLIREARILATFLIYWPVLDQLLTRLAKINYDSSLGAEPSVIWGSVNKEKREWFLGAISKGFYRVLAQSNQMMGSRMKLTL